MDSESNRDEGSHGGILDKARDLIDEVTGGNAGSAEIDNRMQEDATFGSGGSDAASDPLHSSGSVGIGSTETGTIGGDNEVDYASEMGGGAPATGLTDTFNEGAHVRSAYERSTDEPGSYTEGERPDDDETLS
jgi:hypothetical protein